MTQPDSTAELEVLFPESRTVTIAGAAYTITPPTVRQLGAVGKLLKRLLDGGAGQSTVEMLLLSHADEMAALIAIATGRPEDEISALRSDHGLELGIAVWEVWAPFFGTRMLPLVAQLIAQAGNWAGPTSSSA
jgi:hypothetical protein